MGEYEVGVCRSGCLEIRSRLEPIYWFKKYEVDLNRSERWGCFTRFCRDKIDRHKKQKITEWSQFLKISGD